MWYHNSELPSAGMAPFSLSRASDMAFLKTVSYQAETLSNKAHVHSHLTVTVIDNIATRREICVDYCLTAFAIYVTFDSGMRDDLEVLSG